MLGIDWGARRVGLAISDATGTLARPHATLQVTGAADAVAKVAAEVDRLMQEDDGLAGLVIGLPRSLTGEPTAETPAVEAFAAQVGARTGVPTAFEDERLSSREAESRLAVRERDWRRRKARLDAAAAAVILQDFLDRHA
jgi:putative Holliday junction resolvase